MKDRLILHIGCHKTGTTTLQNTLLENKDLLASRGINYVTSQSAPHCHAFIGMPSASEFLPDGFKVMEPKLLRAQLQASPGPIDILSSENFSFFFKREAIHELYSLVKPLYRRIDVLCYIRRQPEHAISHHREGARARRRPEHALFGRKPQVMPEYHERQRLYLDYNRRLGVWADVFGDENMSIRPFDRKALKDGDVCADAFHTLGIDMSGVVSVEDRNPSLNFQKALIGFALHEVTDNEGHKQEIMPRVPLLQNLRPARKAVRDYYAHFEQSNMHLNTRFGLSRVSDIFGTDVSDYPEHAAQPDVQLSYDQLKALVRAVYRVASDQTQS